MRLAWAYTKAQTLELLRYPSFSVPTLAMPAILYVVVGAHRLQAPPNVIMVSYAAFAVLGVAFFQFGVGVAAERVVPWHRFLRVLPATTFARFSARIATALVFGSLSAAGVVALALATTNAGLPAARWAAVAGVMLLGAVPFALLGIAIGYWQTPRGALPAANLLYFGFAYLGGLFGASVASGGIVGRIQPYVPTHAWLALLASASVGGRFAPSDVAVLVIFACVCGALASWGYKRDEGQRFK